MASVQADLDSLPTTEEPRSKAARRRQRFRGRVLRPATARRSRTVTRRGGRACSAGSAGRSPCCGSPGSRRPGAAARGARVTARRSRSRRAVADAMPSLAAVDRHVDGAGSTPEPASATADRQPGAATDARRASRAVGGVTSSTQKRNVNAPAPARRRLSKTTSYAPASGPDRAGDASDAVAELVEVRVEVERQRRVARRAGSRRRRAPCVARPATPARGETITTPKFATGRASTTRKTCSGPASSRLTGPNSATPPDIGRRSTRARAALRRARIDARRVRSGVRGGAVELSARRPGPERDPPLAPLHARARRVPAISPVGRAVDVSSCSVELPGDGRPAVRADERCRGCRAGLDARPSTSPAPPPASASATRRGRASPGRSEAERDRAARRGTSERHVGGDEVDEAGCRPRVGTRPRPSSPTTSAVAVVATSALLTCAGVQSGWRCRSRARRPATCGAAMLVPDESRPAARVRRRGSTTPGAETSGLRRSETGVGPADEKPAIDPAAGRRDRDRADRDRSAPSSPGDATEPRPNSLEVVAGSDDGDDTGRRGGVERERDDVAGRLDLGLAEREVDHVHAVGDRRLDRGDELRRVPVEPDVRVGRDGQRLVVADVGPRRDTRDHALPLGRRRVRRCPRRSPRRASRDPTPPGRTACRRAATSFPAAGTPRATITFAVV